MANDVARRLLNKFKQRSGLAVFDHVSGQEPAGGYGISYEGEYSDRRVNLFMPPFLLEDSALNDRGVIPRRTLVDFYLGAPLGSPNSTIGLTPTYTRLPMGYDQHWNFGVQQRIARMENTLSSGGRYAFDRGPSEFHVPHSFSFSHGYELPFGKGKRLLGNSGRLVDGLLGGWQTQSILIFRSGVPFTVEISRDVANTGVGGQRPNRIASGKLDHPTLERWFDAGAFATPAMFTYGNAGLRILSPDIIRTIDFSVFKQFHLTETSRLQFRFEAFNLPNTPSVSAPNATIDTGTVGRVTSTSTEPRQMQMAVKYNF